ncbi:hypothetical protein [Streptomyces physcomitrii]|uniref:hypothetical protein n=1 Tax=Streptomyces physcomitrii TaxID=2724184 RepID=UPI001FE96FA7|nr:hypothetical protein [Streptomyces physcomitrii]
MIRVAKDWACAALIRSERIAGLTPAVIAELGPFAHERHQAVLNSHPRRTIGAGAQHKQIFIDRLLATLVCSAMQRRTMSWPAGSAWTAPPLRVRSVKCGSCSPSGAAPSRPTSNLRTLAEFIDHLGASGQARVINATEVQAHRPAAGRKNHEKFVSRRKTR